MLEVRGRRERDFVFVGKLSRQQIAEARAKLLPRSAPGAMAARRSEQIPAGPAACGRTAQPPASAGRRFVGKRRTRTTLVSADHRCSSSIALLAHLVAKFFDGREPRAVLAHLDAAAASSRSSASGPPGRAPWRGIIDGIANQTISNAKSVSAERRYWSARPVILIVGRPGSRERAKSHN